MRNGLQYHICSAASVILITSAASAHGQLTATKPSLPSAPSSQLMLCALAKEGTTDARQSLLNEGMDAAPRLTRTQAEQMAIKNNPKISVSRLLALAQHQVVRETRSADLPTITANVTAVEAENGSRISAGYLTSSAVFEHAAAGANFSQLITDFGRVNNLVAFSKLQEKARHADLQAAIDDIVIETDRVFYTALQSKALYEVAKQNVTTRQITESQVSELTSNKLKSTLDLSFADVNLSQARLLQLDAENNMHASMAALDAVLGLDREITYDLVDDSKDATQPPPDVSQLVQQGLQQRPDLRATAFNQQAAAKYSRAQRDQLLPNISAAGTVGSVPIRPVPAYTTNWWGAIGVNVSIPIFNGSLYSAESKEANLRERVASERNRDLRDQIVRDIYTSWLSANAAFQRMAVSEELLKQANLSLQLAQTRYQMGLSSIVELSQAQYQQTDAAVGSTNAAYEYKLALATLNYQIGSAP
jgi:outer membrane protein